MSEVEELYSRFPLPEDCKGTSVEARNKRQNLESLHPLTCNGKRYDESHKAYQAEHGGDFGQLLAIEGGWVCPVCGYYQEL